MKKRIVAVFLTALLLCLFLCSCKEYDENRILGSSYDEVVEMYGEFYRVVYNPEGGVHHAYYRDRQWAPIGSLDRYCAVIFDKDGIAVSIDENYSPPGN